MLAVFFALGNSFVDTVLAAMDRGFAVGGGRFDPELEVDSVYIVGAPERSFEFGKV